MCRDLRRDADAIMEILQHLPQVRSCTLYGSVATGRYDALSDIDIQLDVSGHDNGQFMLGLARQLQDQLPIVYADYAPSLVPQQYIVTLAVDADDPFLTVDIQCTATPHCTAVTKQQVLAANEPCAHILKLWAANTKHCLRGDDCHQDILRMAHKAQVKDTLVKSDAALLADTLDWLLANAPGHLQPMVKACRDRYDALFSHP